MNHGPAVQDVERPPLRLRDCYWFFGPLVLMVELNMMSKSVIHAFLARTDNPSAALAAFNAAFTFYFAITAASEVTTVLCLSFLKVAGRLSAIEHLRRHRPLTADYDCASRGLHAGRQYGVWKLVRPRFPGTVGGTRGCRPADLSAPFLIFRANAFALLMLARRTIIITLSTLVRLLSLTASLALLPMWLNGAAIGAAALMICMATESIFAWAFAWRHLMELPGARQSRTGHFRPLLELCVAADHQRLGRARIDLCHQPFSRAPANGGAGHCGVRCRARPGLAADGAGAKPRASAQTSWGGART